MTKMWNPETTPDFTRDEMMCNCGCGRSDMAQSFMTILQTIRRDVGFGLSVSKGGGFRCPLHPDEAKKDKPGAHAHGFAADIRRLNSHNRFMLLSSAIQHGIVGIGRGRTFIHLDSGHPFMPRPAEWGY
jgi:zinc D-Ala-D-Ala carboxypeptidase